MEGLRQACYEIQESLKERRVKVTNSNKTCNIIYCAKPWRIQMSQERKLAVEAIRMLTEMDEWGHMNGHTWPGVKGLRERTTKVVEPF